MPTHVHPVLIGFGDCDPAGIVYYPNFFRWFDDATHSMFLALGQSHDRARREQGWIVWPLVDAGASFRSPARYNQVIEIHSTIDRWTRKTFRIAHRALRGDTVLVEGWEVRFIGEPHPDDPERLRAVTLPDSLRELFGASDGSAGEAAGAPAGRASDVSPGAPASAPAGEHATAARDLAGAPPHLLDSITAIDERCAGGIIVSGSHGGVSSTGFVLRAPARPRAVIFNDAGVGKEGAGIVALELLDEIGIACATCSHDSARIGDSRDGYENGLLSHVNGRAR
ncbi:MAG: acyl-CoA thioesterase, partial [Gammaproteobacteria bacterium]